MYRFEGNSANFGGGIFTIVDNSVDIVSGFYRIAGTEFMNNSASSDGGAIKAISLNSNNDLFPFNADAYTVRILDSILQRNRLILFLVLNIKSCLGLVVLEVLLQSLEWV